MIRLVRILVILGILALVGLAGLAEGSARAGEDSDARDRAAGHYKLGVELAGKQKFRAALEEFREAYRLLPRFNVLFNIAELERQLERPADARESYERYLREGGERVPADKRTQVERHLGELAALVADVSIVVDGAPAELLLDGKSVGKSPLERSLALQPGRHQLQAVRGDERDELTLTASAGTQRTITLSPHGGPPAPRVELPSVRATPTQELPAVRAPGERTLLPTTPTPTAHWYRSTAGILLGVGAVVAVAAGAVLVDLAATAKDGSCNCADALSVGDYTSRKSLETPGWAILGVGGALALGSIVAFAWPSSPSRPSEAASALSSPSRAAQRLSFIVGPTRVALSLAF